MSSILVVGAGLSGLACAWRLRRAGYDVEVLERSEAPGGRSRAEVLDGFVLESGVNRAGGDDPKLCSLARELGLPDPRPARAGQHYALLHEGRVAPLGDASPRDLLGASFISMPGRLRGARLGVELARRWNRLDPAMPEAWLDLDHRVLEQALEQLAGVELRDRLLLPLLGALYPAEIETFSEAFLYLALRSLLAPENGRAHLHGGVGSLIEPLAASGPLRLGCDVDSIESHDEGVRVRYRVGNRKGAAIADAAVVAVPGDQVAAICPKLTPHERGFFEDVRYCESIEAHLLFERAPALGADLMALPRDADFAVAGVVAAHRLPGLAPEGRGLLRAVLREGASIRMRDASDDEIVGVVLDNLSRTRLGRVAPERVVVRRVSRRLPRFCPGTIAGLSRFRARGDRSPRLAFCGDYMFGPWSGGALASGLRAASELANGLLSIRRRS